MYLLSLPLVLLALLHPLVRSDPSEVGKGRTVSEYKCYSREVLKIKALLQFSVINRSISLLGLLELTHPALGLSVYLLIIFTSLITNPFINVGVNNDSRINNKLVELKDKLSQKREEINLEQRESMCHSSLSPGRTQEDLASQSYRVRRAYSHREPFCPTVQNTHDQHAAQASEHASLVQYDITGPDLKVHSP